MNPIAAQARITVDATRRQAATTPRSALKRIWTFVTGAVVHSNEDDITEQYQGRSWCDSTEHDLNCDVMTGRRRRM